MRLKNYNKPLSLSIFLSPFVIFAQNTTEEYHTIKEKYNAKEFDYKIEETKPSKELDLEWLQAIFKMIDTINWENVMYAIVGVFFCIILFKLYQNGILFNFKKNHKIENEIHFNYIENNLLAIDLNQLIEQAKNDKNYRLAIRYYHYQNTQHLAQKEYILWDPKKTNQQLIYEIKKLEVKALYQNNTLIFNRIWFGNFQINEEQFSEFEANFKFLNQSL